MRNQEALQAHTHVKLKQLCECTSICKHKYMYMRKDILTYIHAYICANTYEYKHTYVQLHIHTSPPEPTILPLALTWLAREPWTGGVAKNFISGQRLYRPVLHSWHCPQLTPGSKATWSPTWQVLTSDPVSITVPADSWPITIGSSTKNDPNRIFCCWGGGMTGFVWVKWHQCWGVLYMSREAERKEGDLTIFPDFSSATLLFCPITILPDYCCAGL